ncbi:unnamed protein product, partial [Polarella glacialis]
MMSSSAHMALEGYTGREDDACGVPANVCFATGGGGEAPARPQFQRVQQGMGSYEKVQQYVEISGGSYKKVEARSMASGRSCCFYGLFFLALALIGFVVWFVAFSKDGSGKHQNATGGQNVRGVNLGQIYNCDMGMPADFSNAQDLNALLEADLFHSLDLNH